MTIDKLKQDWHKKMTALRDERDWLNQHNFKIEAMVKSQVIEAIWNLLYDLDLVDDDAADQHVSEASTAVARGVGE